MDDEQSKVDSDDQTDVSQSVSPEAHVEAMLGQPPQEATEVSNQAYSSEKPVEVAEQTAPEDNVISEAVDDIVAKEGDAVLAAEDSEVAKAFEPDKRSLGSKIKDRFKIWWDSPRIRHIMMAGMILFIFLLGALPISRYFILNTAGVRASASLTIIDDSSQQPVKNIQVDLGGQTGKTDSDGKLKLDHLKLGKTTLVLKKPAYAEFSRTVTLGWGSNPLGSFNLKAVGRQYSIVVKDFLSGKPIEKIEATSGDANAVSDKNGKILLAIDNSVEGDVTATLSGGGYREEKVELGADSKTSRNITLVPVRKDIFVSKRSGKYDVYKIDVDGKNEAIILKGTGLEQENIQLFSHPSSEIAALVSTRDNAHNSDGFLLSTLTLIDLNDNTTKSVVQSERILLLGWSGDRLVYLQVAAGASAANPKRYRLMSYDYKSGDKRELAAGNYFNGVLVAGSGVYYALPSYSINDPNANFTKINADGSSKQVLLNKEVWSIYRNSYDVLNLYKQDWYEYKLGGNAATKLDAEPSGGLKNLTFVDSPDRSRSLWIDNRDGKSVLLAYDIASKTDKVLQTQSGLNGEVRWISNNTVIYRVQTAQETADYVLNLDGGDAKKIKDVTNSIGVVQGYAF